MSNPNYCRYCRGTGRVELATSVVDCVDCDWRTGVTDPDVTTQAASRTNGLAAPKASARPTEPNWPNTLTLQLHKLRHELPGYAKLEWDSKPNLHEDMYGQVLFPVYGLNGVSTGTYQSFVSMKDISGGWWRQGLTFSNLYPISEQTCRNLLKEAVAKLEIQRLSCGQV